MRSVHIRTIQELLGHKTLAMTRRYSHLAPEQLQNAVKLLDGVIGERRELVGQSHRNGFALAPTKVQSKIALTVKDYRMKASIMSVVTSRSEQRPGQRRYASSRRPRL